MLFADDVALTSHTEGDLQWSTGLLMPAGSSGWPSASRRPTSWAKTPAPPSISIDGEVLEVTDHFTFTFTCLLTLAWQVHRQSCCGYVQTENTEFKVYQAVQPAESWTAYARQENRLESFHLRCLRRILGITWQDRVSNPTVLEKAGSLSMHLLLCQRHLRCMSIVWRMAAFQVTSFTGSWPQDPVAFQGRL